MTPRQRRLDVLAELSERAPLHRRILAPVSLGVGAVAFTVATTLAARPLAVRRLDFELVWLAVAALSALILAAILWRDAARRREPLVSRRTLAVVIDILPALLAAAAVSFAANATQMQPLATAGFWMMFYGLALLSTANYAPRALVVLGWAFLLSGLTLLSLLCARLDLLLRLDFTLAGFWIMGSTFGLYHLAYGWLTWPTRADH